MTAPELAVDAHPALDERSQTDVALQHDQRAVFFFLQFADGEQDLVYGLLHAESGAHPASPAHARERAANLRLEQHDNGKAHERDDEGKQGTKGFQARPDGQLVKAEHHHDAEQDVARPGASHHQQGVVDENRHRQDIDHAGQRESGQRWKEIVHVQASILAR
jgi:hypothetical protein